MKGFPEKKFRAARIWSNTVLKQLAPYFKGTVINVSGWKDEDKEGSTYSTYFTNATSYDISNYQGERGYESGIGIPLDLEQELPNNLVGVYDTVFNHTTLEHVFYVERAFKNLCRMSKDAVIIVVPFMQEMHYIDSFKDYWRFTPFALKRLFEDNGFQLVFIDANNVAHESIYLVAVGRKNGKPIPLESSIDVFKNLGEKIIPAHPPWYRLLQWIKRVFDRPTKDQAQERTRARESAQ